MSMLPHIGQRLLQTKDLAYIATDRNLVVVEAGGAVGLLGSAPADLVGLSLIDVAPELFGSEEMLDELLRGRSERFTLPTVNREDPATGETIYVTLDHLPYLQNEVEQAADGGAPAGPITGIVQIVENITQMAVVEQELTQQRNELYLLRDRLSDQNLALERANTELRSLDELKTRFVSVAAHELRSPLAAISGYIDLLDDESFGALTEAQKEFIAVLQRSTTRLLSIVSNLLDVTRIETGRMELNLASVDVTSLIEAVSLELVPQLSAKGHELTVDLADGIPRLLCDETRATQILHNLVSNAIKYTPEEGRIRIVVESSDEDGFMLFAVSDNGIGIPHDDQARLFETFYRAGNVYQTGATGAGLGLNITHSLVELHSGRIWFESEPGQGTTFYFTLPIDDGLFEQDPQA